MRIRKIKGRPVRCPDEIERTIKKKKKTKRKRRQRATEWFLAGSNDAHQAECLLCVP